MRMPIRAKLVLAISILVVVLFSISAYLFINEKKVELSHDIYVNTLAFVRLTSPNIVQNYDLYMEQNSFVYFNREMVSVFAQNQDVDHIKVFSYDGRVLYDSAQDVEQRYVGEDRFVEARFMEQIQSRNIAMQLEDGTLIFIKTTADGDVYFVDKNENLVDSPKDGFLLSHFVVPVTERYSVYYGLNYDNLEARIAGMRMRIIYLAVFGIMLGIMMSMYMSKRITKPVGDLVEGANRIAKGDFKTKVDIKTRDELNFLGAQFNKMAVDLEAGLDARLYQERKTTELELATKIQEQLIPDEVPSVKGIDLAASIVPAGEIGGDIYDFLSVGEEKVLMYLGDVTGHGIPAGIISSIANSLMYGYAPVGDLKKILVEVNRVMKAKTMPTMFMTLCLVSWDSIAEKLSYASAGHEQLIHYKASSGEVELKPSGGMALGMIDDISSVTQVNDVDFEEGDFLVLYSDGIPEAWKNKDESYGMERLMSVVKNFGGGSAEDLNKAILSDVETFRARYEQMDDITLIVIKRN